jgi:hypothetical protein
MSCMTCVSDSGALQAQVLFAHVNPICAAVVLIATIAKTWRTLKERLPTGRLCISSTIVITSSRGGFMVACGSRVTIHVVD